MKKALYMALATMLVLPVTGIAATYEYVTVQGTLKTVDAPSASVALATIAKLDAAIHSGVLLLNSLVTVGQPVSTRYEYVAIDGSVKSVVAVSPDAALVSAPDRMPSSGVLAVR